MGELDYITGSGIIVPQSMRKGVTVYIALGSNLGDKLKNIIEAVEGIQKIDGLTLMRISPVYDTAPQGFDSPNRFYNLIIKAKSTLSPRDLVVHTKAIEKAIGRPENSHNQDRLIDIDILFYGEDRIKIMKNGEVFLEVPHPMWKMRPFVVRPLFDVDPKFEFDGERLVDIITELDFTEEDCRFLAKLDML